MVESTALLRKNGGAARKLDKNSDNLQGIKRILVVEDDAFSQKLLQHILGTVGGEPEVVVASDYEMALKFAKVYGNIDVYVIDLFLGVGKTGRDLYDAILKIDPKALVIMTSVLDPARFTEFMGKERPLPPFLQKPFHPDACRKLIESILEKTAED